ncbi:MAG: hypothetical protein ACRERR_09800 [Moraxellaceae bacterium]
MMKASATALLCLATALAPAAFAAPAKSTPAKKTTTPAAAAAPAPDEASSEGLQTDVVGSKEAPGVFNIVSWKDKAVEVPVKQVSTSILRETLQPLDRNVLRREILLQQSMSQQ